MKKLNKKPALIFNALIHKMAGETAAKIDNTGETFMPVHIEKIGTDIEFVCHDVDIYSIAHYFEQNGDLVPDPDMTFAVSRANSLLIWPLTYQDMYNYNEGIYINNGKWFINRRQQSFQQSFANKWLKNIKHQQSI